MISNKSLFAAAAFSSLVTFATAQFDPAGKTNLALYWGQGPDQLPLREFCNISPADIIPIGFINTFPPAANGLLGQNFGNGCWAGGEYEGPGYNGKNIPENNVLYGRCPRVQDAITYCQQTKGKKIILSIGGAVNTTNPKTGKMDKTYLNQLKNAADGEYFANLLWKSYGPYDPLYTGPRPLDRGYTNDTSNRIDIDGFDFDIEDSVAGTNRLNGETAGYIALIKKLRALMKVQTALTGKKYLITGAPQCTFNSAGKEANMDAMIYQAGFDILFVQFYNQGAPGPGSCTARSRASKGGPFNFKTWVTYVNQKGSASAGAKIYIGLLGGPTGSKGSPGDYLNVAEVQNLISVYGKEAQFGGVMLWDATAAFKNYAAELKGVKYYTIVKNAMLKNFPKKARRSHLAHLQRHHHKA